MDSKLVWAPDSNHGYILGRIIDIGQNDNVKVQIATTENTALHGQSIDFAGKTLEFDSRLVIPVEGDLNADHDDNCSMMSLDEASLLNNIRSRYNRNKIYVSFYVQIL